MPISTQMAPPRYRAQKDVTKHCHCNASLHKHGTTSKRLLIFNHLDGCRLHTCNYRSNILQTCVWGPCTRYAETTFFPIGVAKVFISLMARGMLLCCHYVECFRITHVAWPNCIDHSADLDCIDEITSPTF